MNDVEAAIRQFLDGSLAGDQLSTDLQEYAQRPDGLSAFMAVQIDWQQVQQESLFPLAKLIGSIVAPVLKAYFEGQIPIETVALQIAPFVLIWQAFGIDPPTDADPVWFERREKLMDKITELWRNNASSRSVP